MSVVSVVVAFVVFVCDVLSVCRRHSLKSDSANGPSILDFLFLVNLNVGAFQKSGISFHIR